MKELKLKSQPIMISDLSKFKPMNNKLNLKILKELIMVAIILVIIITSTINNLKMKKIWIAI